MDKPMEQEIRVVVPSFPELAKFPKYLDTVMTSLVVTLIVFGLN